MLSIIICVFNESKTVVKIIEKVLTTKLPHNFKKEVIIVDNCSNDGTSQILKQYVTHKEITILFQKENYGKGNSILEGIKLAKGEYIVFQDADLEYDPKNYFELLNECIENKIDAVFGSRYMLNTNDNIFLNKIGVIFFSKLINLLFSAKFTDTATNHKLVKTKVLKDMGLVSKNFDLDFEIAIKLAKYNYKYKEIPIRYYPRTSAEGKKVRIYDGFYCLISILKFYLLLIFK